MGKCQVGAAGRGGAAKLANMFSWLGGEQSGGALNRGVLADSFLVLSGRQVPWSHRKPTVGRQFRLGAHRRGRTVALEI